MLPTSGDDPLKDTIYKNTGRLVGKSLLGTSQKEVDDDEQYDRVSPIANECCPEASENDVDRDTYR